MGPCPQPGTRHMGGMGGLLLRWRKLRGPTLATSLGYLSFKYPSDDQIEMSKRLTVLS